MKIHTGDENAARSEPHTGCARRVVMATLPLAPLGVLLVVEGHDGGGRDAQQVAGTPAGFF